MQRPGADAAHQKRIAELRLAGGAVGEIAERAVERFDAGRGAGIDHFGDGVVPQILLKSGARRVCRRTRRGIGEHFVIGMAAADPRRLHGAGGCKIGRTETDAVHARRGAGDGGDVVDAFGGLEDGVDQDRLFHTVLGFELRQKLIEIMDVPDAFDLRQHDDVELLADRGDDLSNVIEHPRRVERVDARPQSGLAKIATLGHGDEAISCGRFRVRWNRILQIAEHHVDLMHQFGHPRPHFLDMRRHEMDHALQPQRQVAQRRRRPDRQGFEEIARQFHATIP